MATTSTATTNFDKTVTALVLRLIDQNLRNDLVYLQEGAYVPGNIIPGTNLIRHIAYPDLTVTTGTVSPGTPPWLTEGTPPTPESLSIAYEEFAANQAGRDVQVTDLALAESPHQLFAVAAERIARNAVATVDQYVSNVLHAGTGRTVYAGGVAGRTSIGTGNVITGAQVRAMVATLKAANVPTFPDGTYHAFISPMVLYDLVADTATGGWLDASKYAQPGNLLTGEVGKYMGVRFIETNVGNLFANASNGSGSAGNIDVYSTFFFGPGAFAFGDLQSIQSYMVPPGGDHSDPLAQQALVGWKGTFGAKLLANVGVKYTRFECASSIGANAS